MRSTPSRRRVGKARAPATTISSAPSPPGSSTRCSMPPKSVPASACWPSRPVRAMRPPGQRSADPQSGARSAAWMPAVASRLHPQVEFVQGDAEALPFTDEAFDAVVGNFALLHLGRPEQAAAEFVRVLKAGGRLALTAWDAPKPPPFPRG